MYLVVTWWRYVLCIIRVFVFAFTVLGGHQCFLHSVYVPLAVLPFLFSRGGRLDAAHKQTSKVTVSVHKRVQGLMRCTSYTEQSAAVLQDCQAVVTGASQDCRTAGLSVLPDSCLAVMRIHTYVRRVYDDMNVFEASMTYVRGGRQVCYSNDNVDVILTQSSGDQV